MTTNIWEIVRNLRRAHFNKKLCAKAADAIENLAHERDYYFELHKDVHAENEAILADLVKTQEELAKAEKYIHDHF